MSDKKEADTIAFIAKQILEINQKLSQVIEVQAEMQPQVQESHRSIKMMRGWMDGQEEITASHSKKMQSFHKLYGQLHEVATTQNEKLDQLLLGLEDLRTNLGGVAELGKSAYDIAVETKDLVLKPKPPGGAHEHHEQQAATQ